jgi:hypothetical protein
MEKQKDNQKITFYKRNRKENPKLTNEQLRTMWLAKKDAENKVETIPAIPITPIIQTTPITPAT